MKCQIFEGAFSKHMIPYMKKVSFFKHANKTEPRYCVLINIVVIF